MFCRSYLSSDLLNWLLINTVIYILGFDWLDFCLSCDYAAAKETSVQVLQLTSGEFVIIASLSTRNDTQVISIDPTTGGLQYRGRSGLDLFPSERDAISYFSQQIRNSVYAKAIIGYAPLGSVGLLYVATRLKLSVPALPCGGFYLHSC